MFEKFEKHPLLTIMLAGILSSTAITIVKIMADKNSNKKKSKHATKKHSVKKANKKSEEK